MNGMLCGWLDNQMANGIFWHLCNINLQPPYHLSFPPTAYRSPLSRNSEAQSLKDAEEEAIKSGVIKVARVTWGSTQYLTTSASHLVSAIVKCTQYRLFFHPTNHNTTYRDMCAKF